MSKQGKIAILTGGNSPEKEVSLETASSVAKALESLGVDYKVIYAEGDFISALNEDIDLVFIAMHGGVGENGCIQGLLETLQLPYTGSGVLSSALCMNKMMSKDMLKYYGIKTPPGELLDSADGIKIELPAVIKPVEGGSTIGTTIVKNKNEIKLAIEEAKKASLSFNCPVMVEKYIPGREITVAVLNSKALPILEIKPDTGFYDYRAKYEKGFSEHCEPDDIELELKKKIQKTAEKAFRIAGCRDMARVDFRLYGRDYYLLEINTIPGMTQTSLLPEAAELAGIDFDTLVGKILKNARLRSKKR